ncbi:MAG: hypothetical protein WKG01_14110, partial [Kofleriaceae bacterium]
MPVEVASYVPPSQSELRFLELMATRLVSASRSDPRGYEVELRLANTLAALIGYEVRLLPDGGGPKRPTFLLAEVTPKLGWGVVAGRLGEAQPVAIEVPRPLSESGTWRIGAELWLAMDASVLLVASGDRTINVISATGTGSTFDPAAPWNMATPFQALHQAIHTALGGAALDAMIFEIRGFGATQPVREQLVVTPSRPLLDASQIGGRLATALASGPLRFASRSTRFQDGAQELLDLTGTGNPQLHYCQRVDTLPCALLWFGEATRAAYFGADQELLVDRALKMGIQRAPEGVAKALLEPALGRPNKQISMPLSERYGSVVRIAQAFAASGNIQVLRQLVGHVAALPGTTVRIGTSSELGRPFLVIDVREGRDVMRGLVLVPGLGITGEEVIVDAGGANELVRLRSALVQRPRVVTLSGPCRDARRYRSIHVLVEPKPRSRVLAPLVLVAVIAGFVLLGWRVHNVLEEPIDPLEQKTAAAERYIYYRITQAKGPRFKLTGEEQVLRFVSHAVLPPGLPYASEPPGEQVPLGYDPILEIEYGVQFEIFSGGKSVWSHRIYTRSRQSKARPQQRGWLDENTFSLESKLELTDDRVMIVPMPPNIAAGAEMQLTLIGAADGAVRGYMQTARSELLKELRIEVMAPADRQRFAERSSFEPWDRLPEAARNAVLRSVQHRLSAMGKEDDDYEARVIYTSGFRLPPTPPVELTAPGVMVTALRGGAVNVTGPAELTLRAARAPVVPPIPGAPVLPVETGPARITAMIVNDALVQPAPVTFEAPGTAKLTVPAGVATVVFATPSRTGVVVEVARRPHPGAARRTRACRGPV